MQFDRQDKPVVVFERVGEEDVEGGGRGEEDEQLDEEGVGLEEGEERDKESFEHTEHIPLGIFYLIILCYR